MKDDLLPDMQDRLFQNEFDTLVSLAWNLRKYGKYEFNHSLRNRNIIMAAREIPTLIGGGPGLIGRRHREVNLLVNGVYELKPWDARSFDAGYNDDVPNRWLG